MAKAKYTPGKDGRFQTKVWDGTYNPDGRKHYIPIYSTKSSGDLEKKVNAMKAAVADRKYVTPTDETFLTYARSWLTVYKKVRQLNTQRMYENIIEKHLIILDSIRLQDLRKIHFQSVINNALKMPRTCQQIALTFRQIVKSAIQDKKLPEGSYRDICTGIDIPKYKPDEKRPLTPEEKAAIKAADFTPREKAFVLLIYATGLRRGEALAQTKFTINLKKHELYVNEAVAFDKNTPYIKCTKNERKRPVPLPGYLVDYLDQYMRTIPGTYLFGKLNGEIMTKSSYDKMWKSITTKINLAAGGSEDLQVIFNLTAHVFRHNYCTNLCYQIPAISIKKIAALMGDTEKMVIEVYNHIMEEKENPANVVENAVAL